VNDVRLIEADELVSNTDELSKDERRIIMEKYGEKDCQAMTFGDAIYAMKMGERVRRHGWNGKGQYVFLADEVEFHTNADISEFYGSADGVRVLPMYVIRTAQGDLQPGWLASQRDMMENDWEIVK
jgi:hypothetical protein